MIIDPKTGRPSRLGYRTLASGERIRVAKKSGEAVWGSYLPTKECSRC